jgi:modulator of FtsH protease HflK
MPENIPFNGKNVRLPEIQGRFIQYIVLGIIGFALLFTSWFTVEPEEVGVILRLGKYSHTVTPGLHFKIPFNIDSVYKVPVERQLKVEFGFRTVKAGINTEYSQRDFQDESIMLTGDLNAAEIEWITQYRINDPFKFLFRVRNAEPTFRDINEAVMREVVGDRTVNEVLTIGRQEIATTVTQKLQELCNQYETGIKVEQVVLQDVNPPESVKPAFNEVNEAQQEREKLINQAHSEYNRVIPKARGEAARTIEVAKGYALERVNQAKGEASRFNDIFREYSRAPQVTRQRIYLETMNTVMGNVGRKLITDENSAGILPLFQLDKEVVK